MIESPVDVLKRELETVRRAMDTEAQIRQDHMQKVQAYDARGARHSRLISALLLAIDTLEPDMAKNPYPLTQPELPE